MKRKLIEIIQEDLIVCDNPSCAFVIPNKTKSPNAPTGHFVDFPCPKCGENLLTKEDYEKSLHFMRVVNWINKWFSWMAVFQRKKDIKSTMVHIHKGIHIEDKT